MGTSGRFRISDIFAALRTCLPGHHIAPKAHYHWIYPPQGPPYPLPKGEHGGGLRAEIERGHIKKMARQFQILDCMQAELDGL